MLNTLKTVKITDYIQPIYLILYKPLFVKRLSEKWIYNSDCFSPTFHLEIWLSPKFALGKNPLRFSRPLFGGANEGNRRLMGRRRAAITRTINLSLVWEREKGRRKFPDSAIRLQRPRNCTPAGPFARRRRSKELCAKIMRVKKKGVKQNIIRRFLFAIRVTESHQRERNAKSESNRLFACLSRLSPGTILLPLSQIK